MNLATRLEQEAKRYQKRLILPEGHDVRILTAARILKDNKIVSDIIVIGEFKKIKSIADQNGITLQDIEIIEPIKFKDFTKFVQIFFELRKHKGVNDEQAVSMMKSELFFGAMLLREGYADGMVAGAANPTTDVIRSSLYIVKPKPNISTISSYFIMDIPNCIYGNKGHFIFSDCAVVIDPTPEQLANIAKSAAESCRKILGIEPIVALLSFSSKGSARHILVDKIIKTTKLLKSENVNFEFDGELQFDSAIIPNIANKKAPNSPIKGKANVLIFPDLNSGNIGYKIAERFGGAKAIGPMLQGLAKPINDLSRGSSIDNIVTTCAVTILQGE